jgi:hypothetical protein
MQIFSESSTVLRQDQAFQVIYPSEEVEFLNKEAIVPRTNSHQYHGCVELKATSQDMSYVLHQICNCRVTNGRRTADRLGNIKTNLTFHTKRAGRIYRFGILYSACMSRKLPISSLFSEPGTPNINTGIRPIEESNRMYTITIYRYFLLRSFFYFFLCHALAALGFGSIFTVLC